MSILEKLPFSLCESGPERIDGTGNYHLPILAPAPSQLTLSTLYFLDSHGQIRSELSDPDYEPIQQSQIDWFVSAAQAQQNTLEQNEDDNHFHLSLAFIHIPLPEFGDNDLDIRSGSRREPTEGPSFNSHFYDALVKARVSAIGCGHDHVNDFCARLPQRTPRKGHEPLPSSPWLCYGGTSGFGGYCSYDGERFCRRMRVWELDPRIGSLKTWTRVEYLTDRIDELQLVNNGAVVDSLEEKASANSG